MKIQTVKNLEYRSDFGNSCKDKENPIAINFAGNLSADKTPLIDGILKSNSAQKLFRLANSNPHTFNLIAMALMCIVLRPASILVVPGAKKEDKQYAAAKSIIGSTLVTICELALCIPLAKKIEKLATKAKKKPNISNFPKIKTPKFEAYNYFVNNGFGLILTIILYLISVKLLTKIMNKILPDKKNKSQTNNFHNVKSSDSTQNTFKYFIQKKEHNNL